MDNLKLKWTKEKIDKVIKIVDDYIVNSEADSSECVGQMDIPQINAVHELARPLADVFEDDEYWNDEV